MHHIILSVYTPDLDYKRFAFTFLENLNEFSMFGVYTSPELITVDIFWKEFVLWERPQCETPSEEEEVLHISDDGIIENVAKQVERNEFCSNCGFFEYPSEHYGECCRSSGPTGIFSTCKKWKDKKEMGE